MSESLQYNTESNEQPTDTFVAYLNLVMDGTVSMDEAVAGHQQETSIEDMRDLNALA